MDQNHRHLGARARRTGPSEPAGAGRLRRPDDERRGRARWDVLCGLVRWGELRQDPLAPICTSMGVAESAPIDAVMMAVPGVIPAWS